MLKRLMFLLRALFGRRTFEQAMSDEMRFHMDAFAADLVKGGVSPEEAARRARIEFGSAESHREESRAAVGLRWFDEMGRDLRYAARQLTRQPGFAIVAIATLAIGIGVNAAMFGLIDALLFRPPAHVTDPGRVARIKFVSDTTPGAAAWYKASYPAMEDLVATDLFESVAGYTSAKVSMGRGADAMEAQAMIVTPSFFSLLGVRPYLGSLLGGADSVESDRVVLSYGFWSRQFGRDPAAIGSTIEIGSKPFRVVGVAPDGFTSLQETRTDVWVPMGEQASPYLYNDWRTNRGSFWLQVVARASANVSILATQQRASALMAQHKAERGRSAPAGVRAFALIASRDSEKPREVQVSLWLAGVTAFVLLLACANVGNLVLARNIARHREYAVRLSLGASHWQLRRQLIADVAAIAIPGVVAAGGIEYAVRHTIPKFLAGDVPIPQSVIDARALGFLLGGGAAAIIVVAAVSLLQVRPERIGSALAVQARGPVHGAWTRNVLVGLQSALCLALLFSAGLFSQSLRRVLTLDYGVDLDRTIQVEYNLARGARTSEQQRDLYERALSAVRVLPGVERVALSQSYPFGSGMGIGPFTAEIGQRELWQGRPGGVAYTTYAGAGFFAALGTTSLEGRDFTEDDKAGAPKVTIINASLAKLLFPGKPALGECIFLYDDRECYRVVGILSGIWKIIALDRGRMAVYLPLAQMSAASSRSAPGALMIRTRGSIGPTLTQVRRTMQGLESGLPAVSALPAIDLLEGEIRPWRLGATMFVGFAIMALIIAAIGVYGVVAFVTTQRTREIGIRMALGASAVGVTRVVAASGIGAVAGGLVVGAAASLFASRWMGEVLYQTSPRDPVILTEMALVLLAVAAIAVMRPVYRALRLNPSIVLRSE